VSLREEKRRKRREEKRREEKRREEKRRDEMRREEKYKRGNVKIQGSVDYILKIIRMQNKRIDHGFWMRKLE